MNCDELTYRIAFASISGMGIDLAGKILDVIPSERDFFLMSENELRAVTGGKSKVYGRSYRNERLERALREQEFMSHTNVGVTYYTDSDFPARLLNAPDAPIMLYKCGDCDLNAQHVVSIVGTRKATVYGSHFCDSLVAELAQRVPGLVVVSGLAFGIDICAHRACLRNNVPTVAVQARGLNKIYPPRHRNDAIDIVRQGGMIVTDYQTQDPVLPFNFVARNRIIAALADCTVVAESAAKGGALITANLAQSYNRDVFALPGRTSDPYSIGCNKLIRNNQASLITSADDLIEAMRWDDDNPRRKPRELELFPQFTAEEQAIVDAISKAGDIHINALTAQLGMPVYKVMSTLVELDCRGIVLSKPGCIYSMA